MVLTNQLSIVLTDDASSSNDIKYFEKEHGQSMYRSDAYCILMINWHNVNKKKTKQTDEQYLRKKTT